MFALHPLTVFPDHLSHHNLSANKFCTGQVMHADPCMFSISVQPRVPLRLLE